MQPSFLYVAHVELLTRCVWCLYTDINADRECMFGEELNQAVLENCGAVEPSGEICKFVLHSLLSTIWDVLNNYDNINNSNVSKYT